MLYDELNIDDMMRGYTRESDGSFKCVECGQLYSSEEIYRINDRYFKAGAAIERHVSEMHSDRFESLLETDAKRLTLTDNQKRILKLFYEGASDKEIAKVLDISVQRFVISVFLFASELRRPGYSSRYGIWLKMPRLPQTKRTTERRSCLCMRRLQCSMNVI